MNIQFLSELSMLCKAIEIPVGVPQLYAITEAEKLLHEKGSAVSLEDLKALVSDLNAELAPPEDKE